MILYDAIEILSPPGEMVQWKVRDLELKFPASTYKRAMYACAYNPSVRGRDKWILTASWTAIQDEMPNFGFSESLSQKVWQRVVDPSLCLYICTHMDIDT